MNQHIDHIERELITPRRIMNPQHSFRNPLNPFAVDVAEWSHLFIRAFLRGRGLEYATSGNDYS